MYNKYVNGLRYEYKPKYIKYNDKNLLLKIKNLLNC